VPHRRLTPRRVVAASTRRVRHAPARRRAIRQARDFDAAHRGAVRVCWDLDNTLVDSGALLRRGMPLHEAAVAAEPIAGILALRDALRAELPGAAHFVLSVRPATMRDDTLAWLARHVADVPESAVALVSSPYDKPPVWRRLGRGGRLIVVDDLSSGHETGEIVAYRHLPEQAARIADAYVDLETIDGLALRPSASGSIAERLAATVSAPRL
jgi:hypothetical protein